MTDKFKSKWRRTGNVLRDSGGGFITQYRYSIPTNFNGLIHIFLEYCKKIEPTFVMPKVYINKRCIVVFAREKFARSQQLKIWDMCADISCAAYDFKYDAWDVQNRVVAF